MRMPSGPAQLIMPIFFLQPIAYGSWLPRIPEIQQALGLGPAALALALLGAPVGTLLTLPFAGGIVERIGGRATILYGFVPFLGVVAGPTFATTQLHLFLALMVTGVTMSVLELGLNVEADRIDTISGRPIMSTCHGFWSIGLMSGNLIGVALAAAGLPPSWSTLLVAVVAAPFCLLAARTLPRDTAQAQPSGSAKPAFFMWPRWPLAAVCLFVFGITMTEGAAADWAAIYMRDGTGIAGAANGLVFSAFSLMVASGRFLGDRLKTRFGATVLARSASLIALSGAMILLFGRHALTAYVGFGAVGLGVSVGFPLAVSAAASLGGRHTPATAVALLSFVALAGFLIGPPLIGGVAEHTGIRIGFAMTTPALLLSVLFAGSLGRSQSTASADA